MAAAMEEFGTKSYDAASLNTMCIENQISKGLIYHNFKNKDELYLQCVGQCYAQMTEYLKRTEGDLWMYKVNCRKYYIPDKYFSQRIRIAAIYSLTVSCRLRSISKGISGS